MVKANHTCLILGSLHGHLFYPVLNPKVPEQPVLTRCADILLDSWSLDTDMTTQFHDEHMCPICPLSQAWLFHSLHVLKRAPRAKQPRRS